MNPSSNISTAVQKTQAAWPIVKSLLMSIGVKFAMAVAAYTLIPDHAVMTKSEIEENTQLSDKELLIRKSAVLCIAMSLKYSATKIPGQLATVFKVPGLESKLRASANLILSTPAFWLSYKTIETRVKNGSGSLNIREIAPEGMPKLVMGAPMLAGIPYGYSLNIPV